MNNKKLIWILLGLLVLVGGFLAYKYVCFECLSLDAFKPENIKTYLSKFGPLAIVVYVLLYAINTATLLPPIAVMSLSAGVLFGKVWGTVAILCGAFLGTTLTFFISRKFGSKLVDKIIKGDKAKAFQEKLGENGFFVILPMRLIGFPPWELINYVAGLSKIKYRDYILATMIGIFPASFAQAFLTDEIAALNLKNPMLYVAIGVFVLAGAIPAWFLKKKKTLKDK